MSELTCPDCGSNNCKEVMANGHPLDLGLFMFPHIKKSEVQPKALHVIAFRCLDCQAVWFKLPQRQNDLLDKLDQ